MCALGAQPFLLFLIGEDEINCKKKPRHHFYHICQAITIVCCYRVLLCVGIACYFNSILLYYTKKVFSQENVSHPRLTFTDSRPYHCSSSNKRASIIHM